jgi:ribosome recycling factor
MSSYTHLPGNDILDRYRHKISAMRGGRINSSILDTISVQTYGTTMSIAELATVNLPEPNQLLITPFDKGVIPDIVKAISDSTLNVNPVDDGAGVRLSFPPMTEETRKQRVKEVHTLQEEARVDARQHRQSLLKKQKQLKEDNEITEDDLNVFEKQLQADVDLVNKEIEHITKAKEDEIMTV